MSDIRVNLGCGKRFCPGWMNLDFVSTSPLVREADFRKGIPLRDQSVDLLYHSHVLEHFEKDVGLQLLSECLRVLKFGGVLRVVVPDLEMITRAYLTCLDNWRNDLPKSNEMHHDWLVAEIVDQCARHQSAGACGSMMRTWPETDRTFLLERWGGEAVRLSESQQGQLVAGKPSLFQRVASDLKRRCLRFFLGKDLAALEVGRFRLGGEPHLWMYDEFSLSCALRSVGFNRVTRVTATSSQIDNWSTFGLDTDADGTVYKPDSLFMEAVKEK